MSEHEMNSPPAKAAGHGPSFQAYIVVFCALSVLTAVSFIVNDVVAHRLGLVHASAGIILAVAVAKALGASPVILTGTRDALQSAGVTVTIEGGRAIAMRVWIDPDKMAVVVVGDKQQVTAQLAPFNEPAGSSGKVK